MSVTSLSRDNNGQPILDQSGWYVVHCSPLREQQTAAALATHLMLTTYAPAIVRHVGGTTRKTPLFPGYIFVYADLSITSTSHINATPGVIRLVEFGGTVQSLPLGLVEELKEHVEQLNASGGPPLLINPGDPVYIKSGRLRGLDAVFVKTMTATSRVRVLLQLLGRLNEVELESDEIEPANVTPHIHRERHTRGRGRKINKE